MIRINASTIGRNSIVNQLNKHSSSILRALLFAAGPAQLFEFSRFLARTGASVKLTVPPIKLDFPGNERHSSLKKGLFASFALPLSFFFPSFASLSFSSFVSWLFYFWSLTFVSLLLLILLPSFSFFLLFLARRASSPPNEIKLDRIPIIRI